MLIFVDAGRNVLITPSNIPNQKAAFYLQELDQYLEAIVLSAVIRPAPALQVHSSLSGLNYLNVFGEEPLNISLQGMVAGSACDTLAGADAALGIAVSMFRDLSVVQRALPLRFRIDRSRARSAYLVALTATQTSDYADVCNFQMELLAEPLAEIDNPKPVTVGNAANVAVDRRQLQAMTATNRLISIPNGSASSSVVMLSARGSNATSIARNTAGVSIQSNGDPVSTSLVPLTIPGFVSVGSGA